MSSSRPIGVVAMIMLLSMSAIGCESMSMTGPSIRGNYVLEYRELPGGKHVRPPEVVGMMTLTRTHRNFNVSWTENGKPVSISTISRYTFDGKTYSEEVIYYAENLPDSNAMKYGPVGEKGSAPVKNVNGRYEFKLPLHGEPDVAFSKDGMIATRAGVFVDHWRKME